MTLFEFDYTYKSLFSRYTITYSNPKNKLPKRVNCHVPDSIRYSLHFDNVEIILHPNIICFQNADNHITIIRVIGIDIIKENDEYAIFAVNYNCAFMEKQSLYVIAEKRNNITK